MTSELRALLVEGGASHTWVVVADEQAVWAQEWLPALNAVGAAPGAQRSVLAEIAEVVDLMRRTSRALRSDPSIFATIAQAIPATRL